MRCLIGIDIGTSSCKVAAFSPDGRVLAQTSAAYEVHYPHPGWAEQQPDDWWHAVCGCLKALEIDRSNVAGIGIDGQSWSAILVDDNGRTLCETPIWMDTRAQAECEDIDRILGKEAAFSLCGNPTKPSYSLPKLLWYRGHLPEAYAKARWVLQSNSFIVYRLTGIASQEVSQGYGFQCFDLRKGCWDEAAIAALDLRRELFPPVYACADVVGTVTAEAARETGLPEGIPVVAGGLDAACGTLGAGVLRPGQTQEQGGQAGGMSICMDRFLADERLILGQHVVPGCWLLQGGTVGGGGTLQWLHDKLFPDLTFEQMSALAAEVPPGSDGVLFLPYMAGERSPLWNPDAKGVFFGLDYAKGRGHIIRACMEGVAYSLRHNLETAKAAGASAGTLNAMGGSANSLVWTQLKADVTGCRIAVPSSDTATTWGAAMLAGVGTGVLESFEKAVADSIAIRRTHEPEPKAVYERGYERYRELYTKLEPMMNGED